MNNGECEFRGKIGIIGGNGAMGRWFASYFTKKGFDVLVSDLDTDLSNEELAELSDMVIISTPMTVSEEVVRSIGPLMSENKVLMDLCSLKSDIVSCMLENSRCEVIGCHPMFGQYTESLHGQNVILCRGRGDKYFNFINGLFEKDLANVIITTPSEHDRYMGIVQGVTHLITIATGLMLKNEDITPEQILDFATPVFRIKLGLIGRLFGLDLSLYRDLIARNKMTEPMFRSFIASMEESFSVLKNEDEEKKLEFLSSIKSFLKDYPEKALKETNYIFSDLYKL